MPASTVQSIQDIVAQLTAAFKPQADILDTSIKSNDQSGAAQETGLGAKKDTAFQDITQRGQNRGMLFSGFAPDQQAKYTAGTYLPALANLQAAIANTRNSLLGKKADLATQANTKAIDIHGSQQSDYDRWQQAEDARVAAERMHASDQAFTASENAKNRSSSASIAAANRAAAAGPGPGAPGTDVINYFKSNLQKGGALKPGNAGTSRQAQDAWVQRWFLDNGVLDRGAQQQVWNLVNSTFHRPNDPKKDWLYKR